MTNVHANILLESKTARENAITEVTNERMDDVFHKVKGLVLLPDNTHVTVEMVANYYDVEIGTMKSLFSEHNEELISDGYKVLKGSELKDFKGGLGNPTDLKFVSSLALIPRRAILRIGMLLRDSEIAKQIRTYLLNIESDTSVNNKLLAVSNQTNNGISILLSNDEELKSDINNLVVRVEDLLSQPLFKIHKNMSSKYEILLIEFQDVMLDLKLTDKFNSKYNLFNREFENWNGHIFKNDKINKKQYWISFYGIEKIEEFIYGVKQGIIIKSESNNWISKNGVYTNKIEWQKILNEFDNECAYCGSDNVLMAEHIIPQTDEKSTDMIYNILPACKGCNQDKGIKSIAEFYSKSHRGYTKDRKDKIINHWNKYKL